MVDGEGMSTETSERRVRKMKKLGGKAEEGLVK